jgi:hypothetical protein
LLLCVDGLRIDEHIRMDVEKKERPGKAGEPLYTPRSRVISRFQEHHELGAS